jgi:TRAP-type C4-dicarboxylate transport system substrate-binding protein
LLGSLFIFHSSNAEPVSLKYAFPAPPFSLLNVWAMTPWIEDVNKASDGTLEIKLFPGPSLANFGNVYDRVTSGVAEFGFGLLGQYAGQFPKTDVVALPFAGDNSHQAGVAMWRLYAGGVIANEYERVKPVGLFTLNASSFHTSSKPLKAVEDFKGVKLAVTSRTTGQYLEILGGVPIAMSPAEVYQAVQRGLVAGTSLGWPAVPTFKLEEVTKYHLDVPYSLNPAFVFMNKEAFARLPEKARTTIDNLSGEALSKALGTSSDTNDREVHAKVLAGAGQVLTRIDAAEMERWKRVLAPLTEQWVKNTQDGQKVLDAYRAEVARFKAGS